MHTTRWLGEDDCHREAIVGGKAASLSRLASIHTVPHGFAIPALPAVSDSGAQFEGIARKQMLTLDGSNRDNAWFAIIDDDWPAVKLRLEGLLSERALMRLDRRLGLVAPPTSPSL